MYRERRFQHIRYSCYREFTLDVRCSNHVFFPRFIVHSLLPFLLFILVNEIFFDFRIRASQFVYRSLLRLQRRHKLLMNNILRSVSFASSCDPPRAIPSSDCGNKSILFSNRRDTCARSEKLRSPNLAFGKILNGAVLQSGELSQFSWEYPRTLLFFFSRIRRKMVNLIYLHLALRCAWYVSRTFANKYGYQARGLTRKMK